MYTATVDLPSGVPDSARDRLDSALALVGDDNPSLITAASTAFDDAYVAVMIVVTAVLAIAAIVTGLLLRRYGPGSALSTPTHH